MRACACVCMCVWGGRGGITSCNLLVVIPGSLAMALPIARQRTDELAPHSDPCASNVGAQNHAAYKNQKFRKSREFLHAMSKTRIACWNVRTLGSLSDQSAQLQATIDTMKKKKIELLALSETRWSGHGIVNIRSTTILYSGPSNGIHGVAIALSPSARCSWEAAGSVFHPVSEQIIRICLKCHLSYVTVVAIYAPTNPSSSTTQAAVPSDTFYDQLQSVVSDVPPRDISMPVLDLTSSPGSLSLVHMAWATAMAMVRDCLISARITSFLLPIPGLSTSPSTNPPGSVMEIIQGLVISLIAF